MQQLAEALATAPVHIYGSDDGAPAGYLPAAATAAGEATAAPAQADTAQYDRDRTCIVCWEAEREVRFACGHAVCLGKGLALTLTNPNLTLTLSNTLTLTLTRCASRAATPSAAAAAPPVRAWAWPPRAPCARWPSPAGWRRSLLQK